MLEWSAALMLPKNTYQWRKRAVRHLLKRAAQELRPGATCAIHLALPNPEDRTQSIGIVWRSAYIPDDFGTLKRPLWDMHSGSYRCGNAVV